MKLRNLDRVVTVVEREQRQQANAALWEAATQDVRRLAVHRSLPVNKRPGGLPEPILPRSSRHLDLHGLTVAEAYHETKEFIVRADRSVTVVTGRSGMIRKEFRDWLYQSDRVIGIEELDGGGAFRVSLTKTGTAG